MREYFPDRPAIGAALIEATSVCREASGRSRPGLPDNVQHDAHDFAYFDAWTARGKKGERRWLCFRELYRLA